MGLIDRIGRCAALLSFPLYRFISFASTSGDWECWETKSRPD
jgi:hypothetical protein